MLGSRPLARLTWGRQKQGAHSRRTKAELHEFPTLYTTQILHVKAAAHTPATLHAVKPCGGAAQRTVQSQRDFSTNMGKHNGKARKTGLSVGSALVNRAKRDGRTGSAAAYLHTTDTGSGKPNMQSVIESNDLDEMMAMVRRSCRLPPPPAQLGPATACPQTHACAWHGMACRRTWPARISQPRSST